MRDSVRFLLGHETVELDRVDPTMTVLDWLRTCARRTGTKEGCNEGDCGACTVVVARPEDGRLVYRAVNACIQFVATLDGCQLLTVEDLKRADGALHPVQQAMVELHGSQCGFCTPGFVMSLFAMTREADEVPTDAAIDDALAGNLCRCTGYAPIVRAAQRMFELAPKRDHIEAFAGETLARLEGLRDEETLVVSDGKRRFIAPATLDALAETLLAEPEATILAGSTDVGLWVTKQMRRLDPIVYLGRIDVLRRIEETGDTIELGAMASHEDAMKVLARHYPDMGELWRRFASVQIRNAGTVGGNIANGSPIGDGSPALIAAGATLHLRRGQERRSLPLEDFFVAYGRQDRRPGELVERISVPKPPPGMRYRAYKISKRFDQDISAVMGAFLIRLGPDGRVAEARLAYGGMAAIPKRATNAEAALLGRPWSEATVKAAMQALERDFTPITDMRATAGYRLKVAQNLLMRLFVETTDPACETRLVGDRSLAHV
ncbi:xanthine dehydrogenase small subunit [Benzoatithermus flavus]|uniref:Xanthine dehydrogenase small subunit n=1 Tax=Benzoatithermus flavus TaxID=3108223 RepID=A0ABU8XMU1_9PROT